MSDDRGAAREKVAQGAKRGLAPRERFSEADLAWAFQGHADELVRMEEVAIEVKIAEVERRQRLDERQAIQREAEVILVEQDEANKRERWKKAEAEARERLGLDAEGKGS